MNNNAKIEAKANAVMNELSDDQLAAVVNDGIAQAVQEQRSYKWYEYLLAGVGIAATVGVGYFVYTSLQTSAVEAEGAPNVADISAAAA